MNCRHGHSDLLEPFSRAAGQIGVEHVAVSTVHDTTAFPAHSMDRCGVLGAVFPVTGVVTEAGGGEPVGEQGAQCTWSSIVEISSKER